MLFFFSKNCNLDSIIWVLGALVIDLTIDPFQWTQIFKKLYIYFLKNKTLLEFNLGNKKLYFCLYIHILVLFSFFKILISDDISSLIFFPCVNINAVDSGYSYNLQVYIYEGTPVKLLSFSFFKFLWGFHTFSTGSPKSWL